MRVVFTPYISWHKHVTLASFLTHLFEMIRSDIVNRRIKVGLLQTVEASLQSSYKALPQIIHRADEFIRHSLIQTGHYQLLDLVDAGFYLFWRNRLSICCHDDVYLT